jgi:hypothetical protein
LGLAIQTYHDSSHPQPSIYATNRANAYSKREDEWV